VEDREHRGKKIKARHVKTASGDANFFPLGDSGKRAAVHPKNPGAQGDSAGEEDL